MKGNESYTIIETSDLAHDIAVTLIDMYISIDVHRFLRNFTFKACCVESTNERTSARLVLNMHNDRKVCLRAFGSFALPTNPMFYLKRELLLRPRSCFIVAPLAFMRMEHSFAPERFTTLMSSRVLRLISIESPIE